MGSDILVSGLSVRYGKQTVLDGIDLELVAGGVLAVVGLSGNGKTTLLKAIGGLLDPKQVLIGGEIRLGGQPLAVAVKTLEISMCFQRPFLFPWKTSLANVALHRSLHDDIPTDDRTLKLLEEFGLKDAADKYPVELSGGMQQRVALAREFARQPDILLLDEPFANLDCVTREELNDYLVSFAKRFQTTVVLVTHDPEEAVYVGDRVAVLDRGRLMSDQREMNLSTARDRKVRDNAEFRSHVEWTINQLRDSGSRRH